MLEVVKNITKEFLENRNFLNYTELCSISNRSGSDKGNRHNYTTFYHYLFESIRQKVNSVFEVGIGTNNPNIPSSMGPGGTPGASLRMWRDYFPNAQVYGADVDKGCLFNEERIKTFYVDQTNTETIKDLWDKEFSEQSFDIMIDDGLHSYLANKTFLENSIYKLKSGGVYIIEDVDISYQDDVKGLLEVLENTDQFQFIDLLTIPINSDVQSNNTLAVLIKK